MRNSKATLLATATVLALSMSAPSLSLAEDKVYYKDGTTFELGDMKLKMNIRLQERFEYTDNDGGEDTNSFSVRTARLEFKGSTLDKKLDFAVSNDFTKAEGLRDAFLQWNLAEDLGVKMGQYKTPHGRQFMNSITKLQFVDRSAVSNFFTFDRRQGAGFVGKHEMGGYQVAVFNGNSTGEGINSAGVDSDLQGFIQADASLIGTYDRSFEGDPVDTQEAALGIGVSAHYGQGAKTAEDLATDFDQYGVAGDIGFRSNGFSAQGEVFYDSFEPEGGDEQGNFGFYAQAGYFFVPKEWEVAGRFGMIDLDECSSSYCEQMEYTAQVAHYINGHNLKVQAGVTWISREFDDGLGEDTDTLKAQLQVAAYL